MDTDTVSCGSCRERVHIDLSLDSERLKSSEKEAEAEDEEDDFEMAAEVYHGIVQRYEEKITLAHTEHCLWRKRGSDSSIQRIEGLLNTNTALSAMRIRYESLITRADEIPNVAPLPSDGFVEERELWSFRIEPHDEVNISATQTSSVWLAPKVRRRYRVPTLLSFAWIVAVPWCDACD